MKNVWTPLRLPALALRGAVIGLEQRRGASAGR
jgi:hypothetical protein